MNWWAVATLVGGYVLGFVSDIGKDYIREFRADRRQKSKANAVFQRAAQAMPELIREMRTDLEGNPLVREFIVMPNLHVIFNSGRNNPRFAYYEDEHENLRGKVAILEDAGYVRDVTPSNVPIFRMSEEFIDLMKQS